MPPTSTSIAAPSQPTQPSRKGKKAWRKNVDISTVTAGLESLREEIIQHGKPLAEKEQSELFTLDTTGSKEEVLQHARAAVGKTHKGRTLKMDEILGRRSAVPALENLKSNKRVRAAAVTDGVLEPSSKRQRKDWVSKKEVARLRNKLDKTSHLDVENIDNAASSFDLWADNDTPDAVQVSSAADAPAATCLIASKEDEYVPKRRAKVAPPSIRRPPVALTATGVPTQAVPTPDAGQSYNPSFEDWDSLLTREGEKEVQAEQRRVREAQIAAEKQARIDELAGQPDPRPEDNQESEWEGFETEDDASSARDLLKRKRPERKTPAQRNKIKRRKEAERLAKHQARMAERQRRGEEIVQALLERQEQHGDEAVHAGPDANNPRQRSDLSASAAEATLRRKPTLGPSRASIPPAPLELVLPDELQDSLRRLRPEGNLLSERFRTALVNGKLEARRPVSRAASKKRRVKVTEKWSAKDFALRV